MGVNSHLVCVTEDKVVKEFKRPSNKIGCWWKNHWRAILAELVSTALLLFLGCMTCIPIDGFPLNTPMYSPIGFGLIVLFTVQTFGHISGAHMNPSVTLSAVIWGKMSISLAISYIVAQCFGAIIGYGLLIALSPTDLTLSGICTTQPHARHSLLQALGIEVIFTAALLLIICAAWDPVNEEKSESISIKIGLTVSALAIAGGPLGANMNPAKSLGPAIWTRRWNSHWVYWLGPLIGGAIATMSYKLVWLKIEKKESQTLVWTDNNGEV